MSFRPTHYPCPKTGPHAEHQHAEGPDAYTYICPGRTLSPAEVLAAAADKLEARLKFTTPGPWEVYGDGDRRLTIVGGADREYGVVEDYELNPDDAHYLAVMNPIAGKALVPVLRAFSEAYVRETRHFHAMWNEAARERMIGDKFPGFAETLALARLIIGGES